MGRKRRNFDQDGTAALAGVMLVLLASIAVFAGAIWFWVALGFSVLGIVAWKRLPKTAVDSINESKFDSVFEMDVLFVIRNAEDPDRWAALTNSWSRRNPKLGMLLRALQILKMSSYTCMHSKNPQVARSHLEGLNNSWQRSQEFLMLTVSPATYQEVQEIVMSCRMQFPWRSLLNEAQGLMDRAEKLKTPKGKVKYLSPAAAAIGAAEANPNCARDLTAQARRRLADIGAA